MDSYARAVGASALQGLLTGIWVAAGELSPPKRRASRAAAVITLSAAASIRDWAFPDDDDQKKPEPRPRDKRQLAILGATAVFSTGMLIGRRRMERRWLAALERDGHRHPHRALGVRMGLLSFAGTLPGRLAKAHTARQD